MLCKGKKAKGAREFSRSHGRKAAIPDPSKSVVGVGVMMKRAGGGGQQLRKEEERLAGAFRCSRLGPRKSAGSAALAGRATNQPRRRLRASADGTGGAFPVRRRWQAAFALRPPPDLARSGGRSRHHRDGWPRLLGHRRGHLNELQVAGSTCWTGSAGVHVCRRSCRLASPAELRAGLDLAQARREAPRGPPDQDSG